MELRKYTSTNFVCMTNCDTKGLVIDVTIHVRDVYKFIKGNIYTVNGIIEGTKAMYNYSVDSDDFDAKFSGWVTSDFIKKNFIEEDVFFNELRTIDAEYSKLIEC